MGHYSTAEVLVEAGADSYPPEGLFRNVWDPEQLRVLVENRENYTEIEYPLPSLLDEAAIQFFNMGQMSDPVKMNQRAMKGSRLHMEVEHSSISNSISNLSSVLEGLGKYRAAEELREMRRRFELRCRTD